MSIGDFFEETGLAMHEAFLTTLFAAAAKKTGGRSTHKIGIGAKGSVEVCAELPIPEHAFWRPGRRFDLAMRHANLNNLDDLSADYRGAALRLFEPGAELTDPDAGELDLLMNTGDSTVWCHVAMFAERMRLAVRGQLAKFYERHPAAEERYWGGLRRAPDNYEGLAYYSKVTTKYVGVDGVTRGCRYRLIPHVEGGEWDGVESGLPTQRDFDAGVEFTERWPEEERPKDLLRAAYNARLQKEVIEYRLQIVVREVIEDWSHPVYDPCLPWDTDEHPWVDLARVRAEAPLPHAQLEPLAFSIAHAPESLGVFPADAADDYTSVGDLRSRLYAKAAAKRPR